MTQIESLVLRIPDIDADAGQQIGEKVARLVAEGAPEQETNRHIAELNLQVRLAPGIGHDRIADLIAAQIIQQIKMTSFI